MEKDIQVNNADRDQKTIAEVARALGEVRGELAELLRAEYGLSPEGATAPADEQQLEAALRALYLPRGCVQ